MTVKYLYPKFQSAVVGLAPDKMKTLSPEDMEALCDAFYMLTRTEALGPESVVDQLNRYIKRKLGR